MSATKNIRKSLTIEELTAHSQIKPWLKPSYLEVNHPYPILDYFQNQSKFSDKMQTVLVIAEGQLDLPSRFDDMDELHMET